jgi:hypothetical protein
MVATVPSGNGNIQVPGMLTKDQVVAYIGQNAPLAGVDPAAMLSVANFEGLKQAPGNFWTLPGEGNISFGPPSWYGGTPGNPAAGTPILQQQGENAPGWAWTPAGLDYWIQSIAKVARGLTGTAAIGAIVRGFENPRADLVQGEITNAQGVYQSFVNQIAGGTGVNLPLPGTTDTTTGVQPTTGGQTDVGSQTTATEGAVPPTTGMNLSFAGSIQHVFFQLLLVLVGLALLLGGIYLLGSHK